MSAGDDMTDRLQAVTGWLSHADSDVPMVRLALQESEIEQAAMHVQQAAEKYLKALHLYFAMPVRKIHDLVELAGSLKPFMPVQHALLDNCSFFTDWWIEGGYPDLDGIPQFDSTREEVEAAFGHVQELRAEISRLIATAT